MVTGIKELKDKIENSWLFRKNILNLAKRQSMKKKARDNANYDAQYEQFQLNFLKYWHNLEEVPEVKVELEGLNEDDKKAKIEELKEMYCENILNSENYSKGYNFAKDKADEWKGKIPRKFKK